MKAIEFTLKGTHAFFKIPQLNTSIFFTYSSVHKPALLGLFGAMIGLNGYNQQEKDESYPEYYEKLKDLKISIEIINAENIVKNIQTYNNSTGTASKEQGGNLIVQEQWLEMPEWRIRLIDQEDILEMEKIKEYLLQRKTIYTLYLGSNDHLANISNVEIKEAEKIENIEDITSINGLFLKDNFDVFPKRREKLLYFSERLPLSINEKNNVYELELLAQTNGRLEYVGYEKNQRKEKFYKIDNKTYNFF